MFAELLIHTCTLQKRTKGTGGAAGYGHGATTWATHAAGVVCRLDMRQTQEIVSAERVNPQNEGAPVLFYTLYLDWRSDLATTGASAEYRIANVLRADGTTVDAGPFDIKHVADPGGLGHHLELALLRAPVSG